MLNPRLAIVDDDAAFAAMTASYASEFGFSTKAMHSVSEARHWLAGNEPELTLLDVALPDGSGFDVLDGLPRDFSGRVVMVTGSTRIEDARRAVASPADAYLCKPLSMEHLSELLKRTLGDFDRQRRLHLDHDTGLIGEHPALHEVIRDIGRIAPYDTPVLITGETGTGKDLVARAIHAKSGRRGRFVAVNCGAVPADLLASQLFGHERGSFTGAAARHIGYLEQASGGTLFLDEIGDMPPELQVYLLRALETKSITRIGGVDEVPIDARIIAATHRVDFHRDYGPLRADLYYRIARFPIHVPALRDRGHDVELLAMYFLQRLNQRHRTRKLLDSRCLDALRLYSWPGNVRELAGMIEYSYLRADGDTVQLMPERSRAQRPVEEDDASVIFRVGMPWRQVQEEMLEKALKFFDGDKTATAQSLGISVRTIHNHLSRR
jgi:DNA-binding NtrC family response regulator